MVQRFTQNWANYLKKRRCSNQQFTIGLMSSLILLIILFTPGIISAQVSCGDFIETYFGIDERTPISNCADPFGLGSVESVQDFSYTLNGENIIKNNDVYELDTFPAQISLTSVIPAFYNTNAYFLYRHEGDDYRLIRVRYGGRFNNIYFTATATGTYSIVTSLKSQYAQAKAGGGWINKLLSSFVPIAHADYLPSSVRGVVTFTLSEPAPEPAGASSVLFLPGIMGSRLYEEGEFCDGTNSEKQLWFSLDECRQLRLTTNFIGQSLNRIYTKGGEVGILDDALVIFNIYEAFLDRLSQWKEDNLIADYAVIPYDWRVRLDYILKAKKEIATEKVFTDKASSISDGYLYRAIEELVTDSKSGKVTIVAHSNGGLVIKQFLSNLQQSNDPLLAKIDAVVLVAVPQSGAPGSAIGILHGEDLDPVMSQVVTRKLMNTMPFAHHLLPTSGYFDLVDTPVITFEEGEVTNFMINSFGSEINDQDKLLAFLGPQSNRVKPAFDDLLAPEVVDSQLLDYAKTTELVQNNFVVPETMKVYQVAGTGVPTPTQLTYFTDSECVSRILFICREYKPKLGYRVNMTIDGDATVPVPSALAEEENERVERKWLNLEKYNNGVIINIKHRDILEVDEISDYIINILQGNNEDYQYLTDSPPKLNGEGRLVFQLHSPLDLSIMTSTGKLVSSTTNEVPGAMYRRFGEMQYVSVLRKEDVTMHLSGQSTGSFTLDIEEVSGTESIKKTYTAIPSSTSTRVALGIKLTDHIQDLPVSVDYDGDGEIDVVYGADGVTEIGFVNYGELYQAIEASSLSNGPQTVLLALVKTAERFSQKVNPQSNFTELEQDSLLRLIKQSILYKQKDILPENEARLIKMIVTKIINQ